MSVHKTAGQAALQITRDNLHWGSSLGAAAALTFGFRTSGASYTVNGHNITQFSAFSASEQAAARAALQLWADLANITFTDNGNSNNATLLFQNYRDPNDASQAFAFVPQPPGNDAANNSQGDVFLNLAFAATTIHPGDYNWQTLIHEIGHTLGLEHPGSYNATPGQKITYATHAEYVEDTVQYTVMSYFGETFTGANYQGLRPETPMLHDVAAIQRLYGANMTTRTGDTIYGFNSNAGAPFLISSGSQRAVFTVWDAGGIDTFDFSGYSQAQIINLNAESFSSTGGLTGNIAIAQNVVIENAIGGSGNDTINGNSDDNRLTGGAGDDTLDGGGGTDIAVFSAMFALYSLTPLSGNGVRVAGPDGTDTLTNIERLAFLDQMVLWPPAGGDDDYADDISDTPFGQLVVNGSNTGTLETDGDRDWFRIQLSAGTVYTIRLLGQDGGGGTLANPLLGLHAGNGTLLDANDDGIGHDAELIYIATATGTYFVEAGAAGDAGTGSYTVSVTGVVPVDDFADSLADDTAPIGQVAVNGSRLATLEVTGDRDWIAVQLVAGTIYTIDVEGQHAGLGTLEDPYLRLHGASGALLAEDDDITLGVVRDSRLIYQATTSGIYYIEAGAWDDAYAGTYRVSVTGSANSDDYADGLTDATAPFGTLSVGGTGTGSLEVKGDRDWFAVELIAGSVYTIKLDGQQAGLGTLEDPYLRVRDGAGTLLAQSDDIVLGIQRDAELIFQAEHTGTYYVEAGAFNDGFTGTYTVDIATTELPDDFADSLTDVTHPIGQGTLIGSASGELEAAGDRDWFHVQLSAGTSYVVDLKGKGAGASLADPYLRVYDESGALKFENDDRAGAKGRDAELKFVAAGSGSYYLEVGAHADNFSGTYIVNVSHAIDGDGGRNDLTGTAENDAMRGLGGRDRLDGGAGGDTLSGGKGRDVLIGGADADIFDFNSISESGTGAARDVIRDFVRREDKIDLFDIDARQASAHNDAFKFIGAGSFHHQAGELRYVRHNLPGTAHDKTIVGGDIDGDGIADFQIELTGLHSLTANDFIL